MPRGRGRRGGKRATGAASAGGRTKKSRVETAATHAPPDDSSVSMKEEKAPEPVSHEMPASGRRSLWVPTVEDIRSDSITRLAEKHWLSETVSAFDASVVEDVFAQLKGQGFPMARLMMLEFSQYLERFLWPHFRVQNASRAHLLSIVFLVNEKFRQGVPLWDAFHTREDVFPEFFNRVLDQAHEAPFTVQEKTMYVEFIIHCFHSLEDDMVRRNCLRLTSLPLWKSLNVNRLELQLRSAPQLRKHWNAIQKREKKRGGGADASHESTWLPSMVRDFLHVVESIPAEADGPVDMPVVHYCQRFLELLIDLIAQLPTRRFFRVLLEDMQVIVRTQRVPLFSRAEGKLCRQLIGMLKFYQGFEINDQTGAFLSMDEMTALHMNKLATLQRVAFKGFPHLKSLSLASIGSLEKPDRLVEHLSKMTDEELRSLMEQLALLATGQSHESRELMLEILVSHHEKRVSQFEAVTDLPLYPTEEILWDEAIVPTDYHSGQGSLALPKLNLQFLTVHDYLLRNWTLFRLESTYEIRNDIDDVVKRLRPRLGMGGTTELTGWARMALLLQQFRITHVSEPNLGSNNPGLVVGEVEYSLAGLRPAIRAEWDQLRPHDVLFLLTIESPIKEADHQHDPTQDVKSQYGVVRVRGVEVDALFDQSGNCMTESKLVEDTEVSTADTAGDRRRLRVILDSAQYKADMVKKADSSQGDVYKTFQVLVRRKPKENNFKAILETIRDLMLTKAVVPDWLHDVFLGYGDPASASYRSMVSLPRTVDFRDTFLDAEHVVQSFPAKKVELRGDATPDDARWFRITFPSSDEEPLIVDPYTPEEKGLHPLQKRRVNPIRFTPVQVEAIHSGTSPGLTLVVGPPGTGKTDVAVQTISNLYHNFPDQRILLVTHSNQALNDLFEKLLIRDIEERYLIRLGHGEEELEAERFSKYPFSKYGRVNFMLARRLEILQEVDRLAKGLGVKEDVSMSCETAGHFFYNKVLALWEEFVAKCKNGTSETISNTFPFAMPQPLFPSESSKEDMAIATSCFCHLRSLFDELEECRAFELLRSNYERGNYLLTKQARIVAMTCTHAAITRRNLINIGFKYDTIVMEEAAQILEVETFIPMLLQNPEDGRNRLKRVILIGDHNQLPPVVKNMALQKFSHMEQSLFTRFVRLGVPTIDLNVQGRMRHSLAELYNWRYRHLGDLPFIESHVGFHSANAGLAYDYQFIDVLDHEGMGEWEPTPHFYQNLAEAEYVASTYQYMRVLGYPAEQISVLSTYNGQKHLLRDVIENRCRYNPWMGMPARISTVDRYQGQQNNYILLSLVRTKAVGHLRDVRRLVVGLSRARLGLYIFGRKNLFASCHELSKTFDILLHRPTKLALTLGEHFPTERKVSDPLPSSVTLVNDFVHMASILQGFSQPQPQPEAVKPEETQNPMEC